MYFAPHSGTFQLILFHLLRRIHLSYFLNNLMHQPAHLSLIHIFAKVCWATLTVE